MMIRALTANEIDSVAGAGVTLPSSLTSLTIMVGGPSASVSQTATSGAATGGSAMAGTGANSWNVLSGNAFGGNAFSGDATNKSKIVQIEKVDIF